MHIIITGLNYELEIQKNTYFHNFFEISHIKIKIKFKKFKLKTCVTESKHSLKHYNINPRASDSCSPYEDV